MPDKTNPAAKPGNDLPDPMGERHELQPQEELRVEVSFGLGGGISGDGDCQICLQQGSCELWGCELAVGKKYSIDKGGLKFALFTWHGCIVDVAGPNVEISYISNETEANVAYVNTHAQLEALRDEAAAASLAATADPNNPTTNAAPGNEPNPQAQQGPRVMIVGPPESGKSSLCKTLIAYACKVGRTPLWVDLDPADNALSVPGTLTVAPMTATAVTVETYATCGIPPNSPCHPLVVWHGGGNNASDGGGSNKNNTFHPDLYRAQVDRLASNIKSRLKEDENARASGIIVNTNGWIQDEGYKLLLHAAQALEITVLLIMGHDRLYSMMTSHYKKQAQSSPTVRVPKVLKLPRSGGVVSRPSTFMGYAQSRAVKRYFYGDLVDAPKTASTEESGSSSTTTTTPTAKVPQLTPFLLQLNLGDLEIYQLSNMALSSSLLPVAQQQSTDAIQMSKMDLETDAEQLQHALLAVCHPTAVAAFAQSGRARDLVTAGVAGFCAVERVITETDTLHLLSPCAGSLPSKTLLLGDVTWME